MPCFSLLKYTALKERVESACKRYIILMLFVSLFLPSGFVILELEAEGFALQLLFMATSKGASCLVFLQQDRDRHREMGNTDPREWSYSDGYTSVLQKS